LRSWKRTWTALGFRLHAGGKRQRSAKTRRSPLEYLEPRQLLTATKDSPNLVVHLPDVQVQENADPWVGGSLSGYFKDTAGATLIYSISANSNSGLVNPSIDGDHLKLEFEENQSGGAYVTVRAADPDDPTDLFAEDVVHVGVDFANHTPEFI